jgi:ADP-ribose pyrophosphatase
MCTVGSGVANQGNQRTGNSIPSVARELLVKGAKFNFERLSMQGTDGRTLTRETVRHPGAVVILPILEGAGGRQIVLIRNWRISVERWLYELPAGTLEKGEDPKDCAARELEEETGFHAATITPLSRFYTSPGLSDELMWAYAATGLTPVGQRLEVDERVTVHPTPVKTAMRMIESGEIEDGKSILALLLAKGRGMLGEMGGMVV